MSQLELYRMRPEAGAPIAALGERPPDVPRKSRTRLLESPVGLVENLRSRSLQHHKSAEDFSPEFQVCLPYHGLFVWHVGCDDVVADSNQVLFVSGGESFSLSEPLSSGYGELIVTPDRELLAEIARSSDACLPSHPLFRRRSRRVDLGLQYLRARFLHRSITGEWDAAAAEELMIAILRSALDEEPRTSEPSAATRRLLRRAKEFLEAHLSSPLRLSSVAHAVGASPAYLTDVFRRFEGVPLHKYIMQLRLARALLELPHATDLTTLAFDLGFSSHSHFAAAFRCAFGSTPSRFRESSRNGRYCEKIAAFADRR